MLILWNSTLTFINNILSGGPWRCGAGLNSVYNVENKQELQLTFAFCGNPKPTVTCTIDGDKYTNAVVSPGRGQDNYTYNVIIPTNLGTCSSKTLTCTATGHGKDITNSSIITMSMERRSSDSNFSLFVIVHSQTGWGNDIVEKTMD